MSMEFETVSVMPRTYLDSIEGHNSFMMDHTMDYLNANYDPNPPSPSSFAGSIGSTSMDFPDLSLPTGLLTSYSYGPSFTAASPRPYSPAADSSGISPPTLTYNLSGGEMSSDESHGGLGRHSRSTPSPAPYSAAVPRSHRYNPISIPATRASARASHKRRSSKSSNDHDSDAEEEEEYQPGTGADPRREAVRRQRIESEQRRRDELRDGYSRLKAVLPPSTTKSSKVSLLDRAAHHLKHLEACRQQAESRLKAAETELVRVRSLNEVLSLRAVQQREAAMGNSVISTSAF